MTHRSPIGVRISARRDLGIAPTNAGGGDLELVVSSGWAVVVANATLREVTGGVQ